MERKVIDMTIDEAIAHAREVASEQKRRSGICVQNNSECDKFSACLKCSKEHEQLAEWLEELKAYREIGTVEECKNSVLNILKAHNKALNNLVNACEKQFTTMYGQRYVDMRDIVYIAEQLKAGGNA